MVAGWATAGGGEVFDDIALFTLAADGADLQLIVCITSRDAFEANGMAYQFLIRTVSVVSGWADKILYSCD